MKKWVNRGPNSRKRKEPTTQYKRHLKNCVFNRDGWREEVITEDGPKKVWFAYCSFDCGMILWMEVATLDHHPIPQRLGGEWVLENLRLACRSCNSREGSKHRYLISLFMPTRLTSQERIDWCIKNEKEITERNSMHGIPLDKL